LSHPEKSTWETGHRPISPGKNSLFTLSPFVGWALFGNKPRSRLRNCVTGWETGYEACAFCVAPLSHPGNTMLNSSGEPETMNSLFFTLSPLKNILKRKRLSQRHI
jgi:hypothetical protein